MPIYEYQSSDPNKGCAKCSHGFEIIQRINEEPLSSCPRCGQQIRKIISWCRAAVVETPDETVRVESRIKEYERQGMWSHAAELADNHSEAIKSKGMKMRALENYEKAGYDARSLEKHVETKDE